MDWEVNDTKHFNQSFLKDIDAQTYFVAAELGME